MLLITLFLQAIQVYKNEDFEKAIFYKNRAAAYLKLEKFKKAMDDCSCGMYININQIYISLYIRLVIRHRDVESRKV
jgi:hypothetical protein